MVIKKSMRELSVLMNGILVGKLRRLSSGGLEFIYEKSWRERSGARPISLSLPLVAQKFEGERVYNFFDNLLPDNPQIRARIQAQFHAETDQPFDLLAQIGRDCVGAIQLCSNNFADIKRISAEPLTEKAIALVLRNYRQAPLGMNQLESDFRISMAGTQEKTAFLWHKNKWCRPLDATPTSHIFKLPIGFIEHQQLDLSDSCENELICAEITKAYGLPVAECEIKLFENVKVLISKRFDRELSVDGSWLMRLPQEDLCQALGYSPNLKYQADGGPGIKEIMHLLLGGKVAMLDRENFFKSQILFWLLAAIDGHAKNFSVFIEPHGRYRATPLYDIMSAYPLLANKQLQKQKIKMAMALKGNNSHYHWHNVQRRHFISTAQTVNFSVEKANVILVKMLEELDGVIDTVSASLPNDFPSNIAEPIFSGMKNMRDRLIEC